MADPLSVTASVLGIMSFAHELTRSVLILKKLCEDIKDVPRELTGFMGEIETTSQLLELLAREYSGLTEDNGILQRSLCQGWSAMRTLNELVTEMRGILMSHNLLGAVKMMLKRDRMLEMAQKLQQSKNDLHIAFDVSASLRGNRQMEAITLLVREGLARQTVLIEAFQQAPSKPDSGRPTTET